MVIGIKPSTLNIVLVAIKETIPGYPLSVHSEPELDKSNITQSLIQHILAPSHGSDITFPRDNTPSTDLTLSEPGWGRLCGCCPWCHWSLQLCLSVRWWCYYKLSSFTISLCWISSHTARFCWVRLGSDATTISPAPAEAVLTNQRPLLRATSQSAPAPVRGNHPGRLRSIESPPGSWESRGRWRMGGGRAEETQTSILRGCYCQHYLMIHQHKWWERPFQENQEEKKLDGLGKGKGFWFLESIFWVLFGCLGVGAWILISFLNFFY